MHFSLIDRVLERTDDRLVAVKLVSNAEEYLQDHFPTFPVLPGVMMLEAMTQAARSLIDPDNAADPPMVLCRVRALKYGTFVAPGDTLRVEVKIHKRSDDGSVDLKGTAARINPAGEEAVACSGKLTLRPARV